MEITGTQTIQASREVVWNALNSAAVLKQCLPGCESVERISAEEFQAVIAVAVGPMRARFKGRLQITDVDPHRSCVMVFEGQGGAMGFGNGTSTVGLRDVPEGTELSYSAQAQIGGKLAQVGSRLIDSVAKKMSDDFFEALRQQLAPAAPVELLIGAEIESEAGSAPAPAQPEDSLAASVSSQLPAPAKTGAGVPRAAPARPGAGPVMVPGWWLGVAVVLGSAAALAGVWLVR